MRVLHRKRRTTFFRPGDNSPSTGHFTRKALLCVFAANDRIRLRFYSSTHMPICKEELICTSLFLGNKCAQELIFGIEGTSQHDFICTNAVFPCQFAEKTVAFHEAAFQEAEAWDGPSIIFAYAPCIAHNIDMSKTQTEQKRAVECGYFPLYRYNPANETAPFTWDVKKPANGQFQDFIRSEGRYKGLFKANPEEAEALLAKAEVDAAKRMEFYQEVGKLMK